MLDFLLGTHEFLGNHSFPEFIVGYLFGAALIIGAPTVFLLLAFVSALMKTNGKNLLNSIIIPAVRLIQTAATTGADLINFV